MPRQLWNLGQDATQVVALTSPGYYPIALAPIALLVGVAVPGRHAIIARVSTLGWSCDRFLSAQVHQRRGLWIILAGLCLLIGVLLSLYRSLWSSSSAYGLVDAGLYVVALVLTAGGFILAIFSLAEYLNRPGCIEQVLYKAPRMIDAKVSHAKRHGDEVFVSTLTEYPVQGALSARSSRAYALYRVALEAAVGPNNHVYSLAMYATDWRDRLAQYATTYNLQHNLEAAAKDNEGACAFLVANPQRGDAECCPPQQMPQYQAIVVGRVKRCGDGSPVVLAPHEGIVFCAIEGGLEERPAAVPPSGPAPRSFAPTPRGHVDAGAHGGEDRVTGEGGVLGPRAVVILRWMTSHERILDAIIKYATGLAHVAQG